MLIHKREGKLGGTVDPYLDSLPAAEDSEGPAKLAEKLCTTVFGQIMRIELEDGLQAEEFAIPRPEFTANF
jgi:hypothetical protein